MSDLFLKAQQLASAPVCCYANADIIFPQALATAIETANNNFANYMIIGQRWDLSIDEPLELVTPEDWLHLSNRATTEGVLRGPYWVDYFVFPTGTFSALPDLILGRPGWDNWLVWHTRHRGIPVLDATDFLTVIHHDHHRSHGPRRTTVAPGTDSAWNRDLIGTEAHMFTVGHATHRFNRAGELAPARGVKYVSARALNRLHPVLRVSRPLRHRLGIQADTAQRLAVWTRNVRENLTARR